MRRRRRRATGMEGLVVGNIKTGIGLGVGTAVVGSINPALTGGFGTIAGFIPAVNSMEMSKIIMKKMKRKKIK